MNLNFYGNISNKYILAGNVNQKDLSATVAELNKEKRLWLKYLVTPNITTIQPKRLILKPAWIFTSNL